MLFFLFIVKNYFMKKILFVIIPIIICLVVINFCLVPNSSVLSNSDYLRIHIRANSNTEIDQGVKYKIKDELVNFLAPKLSNCTTKKEVVDLIETEKILLENTADKVLLENGFQYKSKIKIDSEMFPTRSYNGYTLESGIYDAMIVELGEAEGNNWWCVIYPPLCFVNVSSTSSSAVVYKSKILEIIKQFF